MTIHRAFTLTAAFGAALLASGCDTSTWDGRYGDTNGIATATPVVSGTPGTSAHFGSWVNNAWGPNSVVLDASTFSAKKCHPPLRGVRVCANGHAEIPCAVTDSSGRFDLYGLPSSVLDFSVHLDGYYDLVIPYDGAQGDFAVQPAVEIASNELQAQLYAQLSAPTITRNDARGGISFMLVRGLGASGDELLAGSGTDDCGQPDHHEQNALVPGVWVRYRRVYGPGPGETYGPWLGNDAILGNDAAADMAHDVPGSWNTSRGQVVYLDTTETPSTGFVKTTGAGLALALELAPGTYEVEADEDHRDVAGAHWDCFPIHTMPLGSAGHRARATVYASGLTDVRIACSPE